MSSWAPPDAASPRRRGGRHPTHTRKGWRGSTAQRATVAAVSRRPPSSYGGPRGLGPPDPDGCPRTPLPTIGTRLTLTHVTGSANVSCTFTNVTISSRPISLPTVLRAASLNSSGSSIRTAHFRLRSWPITRSNPSGSVLTVRRTPSWTGSSSSVASARRLLAVSRSISSQALQTRLPWNGAMAAALLT